MLLFAAALVTLSVSKCVPTLSYNPVIIGLLLRTSFSPFVTRSLRTIPNSSSSSNCARHRLFRIFVSTSVRMSVERSLFNHDVNSMRRLSPCPFSIYTTVSLISSTSGRALEDI